VSYVLTRRADERLTDIYRYGLEHFGERQADAYFDGLINQFALIAQAPMQYPPAHDIDPALRRCVFGAHVIYYEVSGSSVVIVHILGKEDPSRHLG